MFATTTARAEEKKLPVLRHLVYSVIVGATGTMESQVEASPISAIYGTDPVTSGEPGKQRQSTSVQDRGQVIADVVGATEDGGLIVDISERALHRTEPVTRVGIRANGDLLLPPTAQVTDEEVQLVRLLSRGIAQPPNKEVGTTWTYDTSGDGATYLTHFHVTARPDANTLNLDLDASFASKGATGVEGGLTGKLTYDTAHVVPTVVRLTEHKARVGLGSKLTERLAIDLVLTQDSFQPNLAGSRPT